MITRIVFRGMDHSDAIENHANQQLQKVISFLEKDDREPIKIDIMLEPSKVHKHHKVDMLVKSPKYDLVASHEREGEDFYKTLDHVIDTMYKELLKAKEKDIDKRKESGRPDKTEWES